VARDDGERLARREGGETGDNRPVMILTPRWSFCSGLRWQRSGGAVERRAAGAWRRRWRKSSGGLGFRAKAAVAAWGRPRARGRWLYRVAGAPRRAGSRHRLGGAAPDCGRTQARVRARRGGRESPNRRDPPVNVRESERRKGAGTRASWAGEKELGHMEERKKEASSWAMLGERGRRKGRVGPGCNVAEPIRFKYSGSSALVILYRRY
jgi:hypothetical protein